MKLDGSYIISVSIDMYFNSGTSGRIELSRGFWIRLGNSVSLRHVILTGRSIICSDVKTKTHVFLAPAIPWRRQPAEYAFPTATASAPRSINTNCFEKAHMKSTIGIADVRQINKRPRPAEGIGCFVAYSVAAGLRYNAPSACNSVSHPSVVSV